MTPRIIASSCFGAALLVLATVRPALADDTVVVTSSTPAAETATGGPNPYLLNSGLFTLGLSYIPALVVAIESDRPEDKHLYAPVVGPWLDLADREDCDGAADDCSGETVNKVLLVTDGIFQGLGALQIVGSFVFPETRTVTVSNTDGTPAVRFNVTAASFGRGANGVLAVGEF